MGEKATLAPGGESSHDSFFFPIQKYDQKDRSPFTSEFVKPDLNHMFHLTSIKTLDSRRTKEAFLKGGCLGPTPDPQAKNFPGGFQACLFLRRVVPM